MQMVLCGFLFAVISKTVVTGEVIRLINGRNRLEGELQLLMDGIWSYACYGSWNAMNTKVICRMLRNNTYREIHGPGGGYRTCMYNITCSGNEQSIDQCMKGVAYKSCLLHEAVAVRCGGDKVTASSPSLHGIGVRLVDGYNQNEGKVEVGVNGTWRIVANTNNSWGNKEANVICNMLGYRTNNVTGFHTPTLTEVQCVGNETSFESCSFKKENSCASTYHMYLYCSCYSFHCQGSSTPYCDTFLGTCEPACLPGRYVSAQYCNPCNPGTYQPATNQTGCYYCPSGTYQNLTGQSSCQACPVGTYLNMIGSQTPCDACLPGTYQNQTGQTRCYYCPFGTHQNQIGQSSCQSCPVGTYLSMIGSQTPCNACPPGTYQDQTGQISCKQCPIGTFQNMAEQAACIACEPGTYQNSSGKTVCIPCAGGKTTDRHGSTTQYECYKALGQRDDLPQQTNFDILIVGATLLAGVIIFDIISCAILLRRMGWKSKNSNNKKSDIHRPSLKQTVNGCETASTNDTLNSPRSKDLQCNKREHVNAARLDLPEQEYDELHSYWNTVVDTHHVTNVN